MDDWQSVSAESERRYKLIKGCVIYLLVVGLFVFLVLPLLAFIKFKNQPFGILLSLSIWGYMFYIYASYLHEKAIIAKKVSYTLAVLMVVASFFY